MPGQHNLRSALLTGAIGLGALFLLSSEHDLSTRKSGATILNLAQGSCDPNTQTCCRNPDGTPVPPGTRRGPYTCLPNGTWG